MKPEDLFTCPRCAIQNFSAMGLHRHHCQGPVGAIHERRRLTLMEIAQAQPSVSFVHLAPAAEAKIELPLTFGGAS